MEIYVVYEINAQTGEIMLLKAFNTIKEAELFAQEHFKVTTNFEDILWQKVEYVA